MKLLYVKVDPHEIAITDVPPGGSLFWPRNITITTGLVMRPRAAFWRPLTVRVIQNRRVARLTPLVTEVQDNPEAFRKFMKSAIKKLSKSRRERGVLVVFLKGKDFSDTGLPIRYIGFCHFPSLKKWDEWAREWYRNDSISILEALGSPPPKGYPTEV